MNENGYKQSALSPLVGEGGYPLESGIFGVNAEITRKGFFGGLCAQMLNNRKLLMGEEGVDGWSCEGFERFERVTDRPHESLCQSGFVILRDGRMAQRSEVITLQEGRTYEAALWVKAYAPSEITFGVEGMEQTFALTPDDEPYRALTFTFEGRDTAEGTFAVTVAGEAAVFEASLLPTDHFYGMRRDVIEGLKALAPTAIRFPGGCAADHFDWKESLKAPEFRKPADGLSKAWFLFRDTYHQDPLDIGLCEFMMLCREVGAEPEFTVSLILSDGEDARRLVEYCNGTPDTVYGGLRQAQGFDAFGIHLWYVGNEAYFFGGEYQGAAVAARRTDELIAAMKQADPTIAVAIGLTWGYGYRDWAREFMETLTSDYEYVSYHDYIGILPDATQGRNGMATCEILEENFKDGTCFGLDFYRGQLFAENFDPIRICVDEWNYSWGQPCSNALFFSNALQFHFLAKGRETYHIVRGEFFMPVNEGMLTVTPTECRMESTGELFRLMANHRGGRVIPCPSDNPDLDILCTDHGDKLFLSVVNRRAEACALSFAGYAPEALTEIHTGEYSFESNDFSVEHPESPVVHGHSVLFFTLKSAT